MIKYFLLTTNHTLFIEISEFYMNATEEMTLSKFHTEKDIIENLDLTPFPAKIKLSDVPSIQTSLLKVFTFILTHRFSNKTFLE